ncbi:unnamed protein product [Camellia sinensis]
MQLRAKMSSPVLQGFTKSLAMTVVSEIGDRTFCIAAILAMRHPRKSVLFGCLSSVIPPPGILSISPAMRVTTILSALVGWAAPSLYDDDNDELKHVEKQLNADTKAKTGKAKSDGKKGEDKDFKKQKRAFLNCFFSPVFLKAFSVTFFGEWGDKSQLATISLAADEDALAVILGGITAQTLCTVAAVIGGKSLASRISERLRGHTFERNPFLGFWRPILTLTGRLIMSCTANSECLKHLNP